ncbi:MAG: DUF4910 domain-containing protein [Bacteroidales bacterium]
MNYLSTILKYLGYSINFALQIIVHLAMRQNLLTIFLILLLNISLNLYAQNKKEAIKTIEKLCSKEFAGRGYTSDGDKKAAKFIAERLKKYHVKPFGRDYYQPFTIPVNTFPGNMKVALNGITLIPAYDYLVNSKSCRINGVFPVIIMDSSLINYPDKMQHLDKEELSQSFLLIDTSHVSNKGFKDAFQGIVESNYFKARGIILIEPKELMHSPSMVQQNFPRIRITRNALPNHLKEIELYIDNEFISNYQTQNVAGFIQGRVDTCIVFTAHYDHLGEMGKGVYFPGANDNASGVSMVLDLASYYSKKENKPEYSMVFLFFSAEEIGLVGSSYFVSNPLFPLSKVKMLVNLDLVGSGDKGITIVNGSVYKKEFDKVVEINKEKNYLPNVVIRGPAPNSDHFPFYDKGVKSFFIYTMGEYKEYHSVFDKPDLLPLNKYNELFRLLLDFVNTF